MHYIWKKTFWSLGCGRMLELRGIKAYCLNLVAEMMVVINIDGMDANRFPCYKLENLNVLPLSWSV